MARKFLERSPLLLLQGLELCITAVEGAWLTAKLLLPLRESSGPLSPQLSMHVLPTPPAPQSGTLERTPAPAPTWTPTC